MMEASAIISPSRSTPLCRSFAITGGNPKKQKGAPTIARP
jgi:hypothetical protein